MISIDQLLESVDLDFEPRFVTKDMNGIISIYAERPQCLSSIWAAHQRLQTFGKIKLAEFEGKNWTECIYEVPRKATGKIEKLENELMKYTFDGKEYETLKTPSLENFMDKINELVDAVNELKGAKNE